MASDWLSTRLMVAIIEKTRALNPATRAAEAVSNTAADVVHLLGAQTGGPSKSTSGEGATRSIAPGDALTSGHAQRQWATAVTLPE